MTVQKMHGSCLRKESAIVLDVLPPHGNLDYMIIKTLKIAKRWMMIVFGFTLLIIGILLAIPGVPGPGLVIVWAGLALLAVEFVWARRLLKKFKDQGTRLKDSIIRKKDPSEKQATLASIQKLDPDSGPS